MKANEAPEKIYIDDFGSELSFDWHKEHCYEKDIEYTRTDAFIKKACAFLETYPHMFFGVLRSDMIEDFKNYIKGE